METVICHRGSGKKERSPSPSLVADTLPTPSDRMEQDGMSLTTVSFVTRSDRLLPRLPVFFPPGSRQTIRVPSSTRGPGPHVPSVIVAGRVGCWSLQGVSEGQVDRDYGVIHHFFEETLEEISFYHRRQTNNLRC